MSSGDLRAWLGNGVPLAGALPSWALEREPSGALRARTSIAYEERGVLALYLGARWVDARGHPPGSTQVPFAWVPVYGHGRGLWQGRTPRWDPKSAAWELRAPPGWNPQPSWRWALEREDGRQTPLHVRGACRQTGPLLQPCRRLVSAEPKPSTGLVRIRVQPDALQPHRTWYVTAWVELGVPSWR